MQNRTVPGGAGVPLRRSFGYRESKHADVSILTGAPERYCSVHVSGHIRMPTRSILVTSEMYGI